MLRDSGPVPEGVELVAQRTRLELEHRNIERHGPGWEGVRDGVADAAGWTLYLDRYANFLTTSA